MTPHDVVALRVLLPCGVGGCAIFIGIRTIIQLQMLEDEKHAEMNEISQEHAIGV